MGSGLNLSLDLSGYSEIEIKYGMDFVGVSPEHLVKCLSWLFCDVDTDIQEQDATHEPIVCPYCGCKMVDE